MNKTKILIVDDEASVLEVVKRSLEANSYVEVRTESDSRRALHVACEFWPDLILLDINMPNMDGGDVAQALRGHALTKDIPIIFLSALAATTEAREQSNAGDADYFVAKPVTAAELLRAIEDRLGRSLRPPAPSSG